MEMKTKQSGFSLIELMIALVVLAIGIMGIAQLQVAAIRSLTLSRHQTMATQLAQREMEWLRGLPMAGDTVPALDSTGQMIKDANAISVLEDINGLTTTSPVKWHWLPNEPLNEFGAPSTGEGLEFYMRWSIERCCVGGAQSSFNPASQVISSPGGGQMSIWIQVFWWENDKLKPSIGSLQNFDTSVLRPTNGHMVELRSLRTVSF